ncbi:hypothetical protein [Sphingomonas sp. MA1305]|uniref:hypothetical protein n=1 Tax=Sphingomonas sp. MA1305 TaxID=2479204 RepID=UPI001E410700|nr:hypothetical protein [Sphingomonas sp. MA1305]
MTTPAAGPSFAGLLTDAWALFRRDADLLLRAAGLFLFVPSYALVLLVAPFPMPDATIADAQARAQSWMTAVDGWMGDYGLGCTLAYLATYFGIALLYVLLLDSARPTVGQGLLRTLRLFPRFLLAMLVVAIPSGAGLWLVLLPGLWLMSRFLLAGPILVAEAPVGALAAVGRSWRRTRRAQLALLGATAFLYLAAMLAGQPFLMFATYLGEGAQGQPIAVAMVDALAAAVATAAQLGGAMIAVAAYRRLAVAR